MYEILESENQKRTIPSSCNIHLWLSVLDRAIKDLTALERVRNDPMVREDPVFIYDYNSLKKWFRSTEMEIGSFRWICYLVEVDPLWALKKLEKQMQIQLIKKSIVNDQALSSASVRIAA